MPMTPYVHSHLGNVIVELMLSEKVQLIIAGTRKGISRASISSEILACISSEGVWGEHVLVAIVDGQGLLFGHRRKPFNLLHFGFFPFTKQTQNS